MKLDRKKLARLEKLAELKAETAIAELAKLQRAKNELTDTLAQIDTARRQSLVLADDPLQARAALKFVEAQLQRRKELLSRIAGIEAARLQKLDRARLDEGRRQIVAKLLGQAS